MVMNTRIPYNVWEVLEQQHNCLFLKKGSTQFSILCENESIFNLPSQFDITVSQVFAYIFIAFDIIVFISSLFSYSRYSLNFIEPNDSLSGTTGTCSEPEESTLHTHVVCFLKTNINFLSTSTTRSSKLSLPITISEQLHDLIFNHPASICPPLPFHPS